MSIGVCGVIHLIGHIFMIHMDSFNSRFDSGSRAHFQFRMSPEIHLF